MILRKTEDGKNGKSLIFDLPWPPSVNSYYRAIPRGKFATNIISKDGRTYKEKKIPEAMKKGNPKPEGWEGRIRMTVIAFPPDKRRRDLDNIQKPLWDALEEVGVYKDDAQIDDYQVLRGEIVKGGRVMVEVEEVQDYSVIVLEDVISALSSK